MAYGSNYYSEPYYGQGAAVAEALQLKTVTATVVTAATISLISIVNKILTAAVTTTATINRMFLRTLSVATVTTLGSLPLSIVIKALNIIHGITKFLTGRRTTRDLNPARTTQSVTGLRRTTRRIKEE